MATRAPRAQTAAAKTVPASAPAESPIPQTGPIAFPAAWGTEPIETFAGHDLTEKKELVGVPFLIIGVEIERNESRGYDVAYVYALDANGTEFEFADSSSTGVKAQLQTALAERNMNPAPGGGFQKFRMGIMKGLRVSEFKFRDDQTGKNRDAAVYYLAADGRSIPTAPAEQSAGQTA